MGKEKEGKIERKHERTKETKKSGKTDRTTRKKEGNANETNITKE